VHKSQGFDERSAAPSLPGPLGAGAPGLSSLAQNDWTIDPRATGIRARVRELWQYRRLLRFFGRRAIAKLYRNTILGRAWILIRPLFPLLVKTVVFGGLLGVASGGIPYLLFLLVGTAVWDLFASSLMWATRSLELNRGLIGKVYVPRVILPLATMTPGLVNFGIQIVVIAVTVAYYRATTGVLYLHWSSGLLWAPFAAVMALGMALAIGFFTSVLGATARDVRFTLAYVLDIWFFATPVLYPASSVPERWQWVLLLNPMASFVEAFKFGVLGIGHVEGAAMMASVALLAVVFVCGGWYFAHAENSAVDRV
jgi:lipopolysaccharide transport system permease protein